MPVWNACDILLVIFCHLRLIFDRLKINYNHTLQISYFIRKEMFVKILTNTKWPWQSAKKNYI